MAPSSSRDRISVDLRGLKLALLERARATGLTPSGLVREALVASLGQVGDVARHRSVAVSSEEGGASVRMSLRVTREQAHSILEASRRAQLGLGAFVFGLVAGIPAVTSGQVPRAHVSALTATNAELATLVRNLHHLAGLLRQGEHLAAQPYLPMLQTLARDVRAHLDVATRAMRDLQPARSVHHDDREARFT